MNKESFNKYNKAITAKRDELTVYVQQQFGSINFNVQNDGTASSTRKESNGGSNNKAGMAALIIGAAVVCGGIACKSEAVAIGGGVVAAGGLYVMTRKQEARPTTNSGTQNFTSLTDNAFSAIERTHKKVTGEWDDYLGKMKDELKNEIAASELSEDTKNKMTEIALGRSLIQVSLPNALARLRTAEMQKSVEAYRSLCSELTKEYTEAIATACADQGKRYAEIAAYL